MRSLFEKEEKATLLNQLKVDLISRFFPFSKADIIKYRSVLNFNRFQFMCNELVQWDDDLLEEVIEKIDWTALYKIKNINLDVEFFKKYENQIDFSTIHLSKNIKWSDDLIASFGDKFDWSKTLIIRNPLANIDNLRRYKDKLDWNFVSQRINIDFTDDILEEFSDKWDWKQLSANTHLPISVEFIQKHIEKLDFDELSQNPSGLGLIYKYPTSKKWNWEKVIVNPAIIYDKDSFHFIFSHYKRYLESKNSLHPTLKKIPLVSFLKKVFTQEKFDISYFLQNEFIPYLPWENLSMYCNTLLTLEFIDKYKDKLNFNMQAFIKIHKEVIPTEFIEANHNLFNAENYSFYYLPITIQLLSKYNKISWNYLSSSEKFDWTWEYIDANLDKFNFSRLGGNKGIYDQLIKGKLTNQKIFQFLDNQILNTRK